MFLLLTLSRLVEKQVTTLREDATEGRFHHSNTRANFLEFSKQLFFWASLDASHCEIFCIKTLLHYFLLRDDLHIMSKCCKSTAISKFQFIVKNLKSTILKHLHLNNFLPFQLFYADQKLQVFSISASWPELIFPLNLRGR